MVIKILGTGCAKCTDQVKNVRKALAEKGVEAEVIKVESLKEIVSYGVMSTPAIVIDGVVKASGRVVSAAEIAGWL